MALTLYLSLAHGPQNMVIHVPWTGSSHGSKTQPDLWLVDLVDSWLCRGLVTRSRPQNPGLPPPVKKGWHLSRAIRFKMPGRFGDFWNPRFFLNLYGRCIGLFGAPANPRMASTTPWLTPTLSLDLHTFHWCCGSFWPPKERRSMCGAVWCSSGSLYSASVEVSAWLLISQT